MRGSLGEAAVVGRACFGGFKRKRKRKPRGSPRGLFYWTLDRNPTHWATEPDAQVIAPLCLHVPSIRSIAALSLATAATSPQRVIAEPKLAG